MHPHVPPHALEHGTENGDGAVRRQRLRRGHCQPGGPPRAPVEAGVVLPRAGQGRVALPDLRLLDGGHPGRRPWRRRGDRRPGEAAPRADPSPHRLPLAAPEEPGDPVRAREISVRGAQTAGGRHGAGVPGAGEGGHPGGAAPSSLPARGPDGGCLLAVRDAEHAGRLVRRPRTDPAPRPGRGAGTPLPGGSRGGRAPASQPRLPRGTPQQGGFT